MDLVQAYEVARQNDQTLEIARYTLAAVEQRVPQARAGLLPSVNVVADEDHTLARAEFTGIPPSDRAVHAWNWALQLTQPLLRLQNWYAYGSAQAQELQARFAFRQAEQDLIVRLAQAYFDVVTAEEAIGASNAQVTALQEQWLQAKAGFARGVSTVTDVHDARSKLEAAIAQKLSAEDDLDVKRGGLSRLLGEEPTKLATLGATVVTPHFEKADVQNWMSAARENNPTVLAQRAALESADAEVEKAQSEYSPTIDLTASTGANRSSGSLSTPDDFASGAHSKVFGVQLTVPLFAGGATRAKVAEMRANRAKAAAQLEDARRQAALDARQAFAGVNTSVAQVSALQQAVEASEEAVKGNRAGYKLGIRINSDVLQAEQQLFANRRDLVKARYDVLLQGLKLKAASGTLTENDVHLLNANLTE